MPYLIEQIEKAASFIFPQTKEVRAVFSLNDNQILEAKRIFFLKELNAISIMDYGHPTTKAIVWALKFSKSKIAAQKVTKLLYPYTCRFVKYISEQNKTSINEWILVPVPSSNKKRKQKGFNQPELLCNALVEADINKILKFEKDLITKVIDTKNQHSLLNKRERLKNLTGAFNVANPSLITNKAIILIDDVITTGSTIKAVRQELEKYSPLIVVAASVAYQKAPPQPSPMGRVK